MGVERTDARSPPICRRRTARMASRLSRPRLFVIPGIVLCVLGVLPIILLFTTDWMLSLCVAWAEAWNPGIDAPDNWAVGATYIMLTSAAVGAVGCLAVGVGVLLAVRRAPDG